MSKCNLEHIRVFNAMENEVEICKGLLTNIENRVRQGQLKVYLNANAEM